MGMVKTEAETLPPSYKSLDLKTQYHYLFNFIKEVLQCKKFADNHAAVNAILNHSCNHGLFKATVAPGQSTVLRTSLTTLF